MMSEFKIDSEDLFEIRRKCFQNNHDYKNQDFIQIDEAQSGLQAFEMYKNNLVNCKCTNPLC